MADERGLGWRTVERAKAKLAVRSRQVGWQGLYEWYLPNFAAEAVDKEADVQRMLEAINRDT